MALYDEIVGWENGTLSDDEEDALFQRLVDSGAAWQLQGAYGRRAVALIDAGRVRPARTAGNDDDDNARGGAP